MTVMPADDGLVPMLEIGQRRGFFLSSLRTTDLEKVFDWRNQPQIRAQMFNAEPIAWNEHLCWYDRLRQATDRCHLLVAHRGEPVGVANLRTSDGNRLETSREVELGLYIGHQAYRSSLLAFVPAILLLEHVFSNWSVEQVTARVKPTNVAALRFNQRLGYRRSREEAGCVHLLLDESGFRTATRGLQRLKVL